MIAVPHQRRRARLISTALRLPFLHRSCQAASWASLTDMPALDAPRPTAPTAA